MLFQFILFVILGWCTFVSPPNGAARTVLMVVYVVLMALWLLAGYSGWSFPKLN